MEANNSNRHNHIDAAIQIVRACGPVAKVDIAREIRVQAQNGTPKNCNALAESAIEHGLATGWLKRYDDVEDAYVLGDFAS